MLQKGKARLRRATLSGDRSYYFILELFKEVWECGYNNIEKTVKITSGFSILIRQHDALIDIFIVRFVDMYLFLFLTHLSWRLIGELIV